MAKQILKLNVKTGEKEGKNFLMTAVKLKLHDEGAAGEIGGFRVDGMQRAGCRGNVRRLIIL